MRSGPAKLNMENAEAAVSPWPSFRLTCTSRQLLIACYMQWPVLSRWSRVDRSFQSVTRKPIQTQKYSHSVRPDERQRVVIDKLTRPLANDFPGMYNFGKESRHSRKLSSSISKQSKHADSWEGIFVKPACNIAFENNRLRRMFCFGLFLGSFSSIGWSPAVSNKALGWSSYFKHNTNKGKGNKLTRDKVMNPLSLRALDVTASRQKQCNV